MVVILKSNAEKQQVTALLKAVESLGLKTNYSEGQETTVVGLVGDSSRVDIDALKANEIVEDVKRISEPYKKANRRFHPMDTIVQTGSIKIGEGFFHVIAGPCSIESEEQLCTIAQEVKKSGATLLRGGAFKPRTSPYSFQGLETDGLKLLLKAKKLTGLPIVTEIMGQDQIDDFADVDIIQVGARNMQNYDLLKEMGSVKKPILLKRGLANTLKELLMSAEYIMASGNDNVILCERGIRFSAEDMLSTIQSEKEEHGSLDIETIRNIDVPSYVAGRSYSHLGEIAKYRKRALDQIIRYAGYLEQIHAPAEYLEQVNVLQESVSDLTIKTKDLKPFRFRL